MNNKIRISFLALSTLTIFACSQSQAQESPGTLSQKYSGSSTVRVDNLADSQEITENVPTLMRIVASDNVDSVRVLSNGVELGSGERQENSRAISFNFSHTFTKLGEQDLTFEAHDHDAVGPLASQTIRVNVVPQNTPANSRYFNKYILKAVAHLTKHWGLLGYDITKQLTHPLDYNKKGTLTPTGNGLTMCVSGALETIITAFEIYAKETGSTRIYDFLPFSSWNTLHETNIKAYIWVNPKLNSSGTADALAKFGMGENVKFKDLEPGAFINLNRTTGTGHAVIFLSFIDIKGKDLATYSDKVVGFRYFGAQGKKKKGQGGFSYRHAFFGKNCPEVPYQRDCNVIYSESQKMLNAGMMWDPADWKKKSLSEEPAHVDEVPLTEEERANIHSPLDFDGLTTDDL